MIYEENDFSHIVLDAHEGQRFWTNDPDLYAGKDGYCVYARERWQLMRNFQGSIFDYVDRVYEGGLTKFLVDSGIGDESKRILLESKLFRASQDACETKI